MVHVGIPAVTLPTRTLCVFQTHRQELLAQCEYYGLDVLASELHGHNSPIDLRPQDGAMLNEQRDCQDFFASEADETVALELHSWEQKLLRPVFGRYDIAIVRIPT